MNLLFKFILLSFLFLGFHCFAQDLSVSQWAKKPDVVNPVALTFDYQGKAYILNARRRGSGSLDIRRIRNWVLNDLTFKSVEERQQFYRANLSAETSNQNKKIIKQDFNKDGKHDWRDLLIIEDPITTHVDSNSNGLADVHGNVINPVHTETSGLAAGVLWHEGHLYLMHEPNLWKYSDTTGDGHFDTRKILSSGYSVHIGQGGHNTSGLAIGLDGRLYWSVADKGLNASSVDGKDRHVYPHRGAVMRSELDGSNLEVFTLGVRNAQELAFDKFGNLFSVDNDGDYPTERERFLYLIEGGETGWRLHWQWHKLQKFATISGELPYNVWMQEKMSVPYNEQQPAYIVPPIKNYKNGPCGMSYNPGGALNSAYKNHFFHASSGDITAFRVENKGASFEMVDEKIIAKGKTLTGLAFSPQGALFAGSCLGYPNYPATNGFVLKIDDNNSDLKELRQETADLLANGFKKSTIDELYKNLHHADLRVRRDSQFELVRRGESGQAELIKAAQKGSTREAKIHGLWGLGQLARKNPVVAIHIVPFLKSPDVEVKATAIRVIGDAHFKQASRELVGLLKDSSQRIQSLASIALGKLNDSSAVSALYTLAAQNNGKDPYLRHSIVMGLVGSASDKRSLLTAASTHNSDEVKMVALLALRRLKDPNIRIFLNDKNLKIVTEAARAIHDDFSIPAALPDLARVLQRADIAGEALIRRAINANLRVGGRENAEILKSYILNKSTSQSMQRTALACYAFWANPSGLDAVEGRYRQYKTRAVTPALAALTSIAPSLAKLSPRVISIYLRVVNHLKASELSPVLVKFYDSSDDSDLKIKILTFLVKVKAPESAAYLEKAEKDKDKKIQFAAASLLGKTNINDLQKMVEKGTLKEKRQALEKLSNFPSVQADKLTIQYLTGLVSWKKYRELTLEILELADKRSANNKKITDLIAQFKKKTSKKLSRYRPVSYGGDADKGKSISMGHPAAQCIRCHKIGAAGGILGPDLSTIGSRFKREELAEALVAPGATLAKGFGILTLTLNDGKVITGTMKDENKNSYSLLSTDGKVLSVSKKEVKSVNKLSPMPPMKAILNDKEIRDLVEYLTTLK
jgi:quinoprotein glucose dehydrogenase